MDVRKAVQAYHNHSGIDLDFDLLGIPLPLFSIAEYIREEQRLQGRYGTHEHIINYPTEFSTLREVVSALDPKEGDVVYDLGSGYGTFVFYTALVTSAQVVGVELVKEYAQKAQEIKSLHGISNARFINANVREVDLSPATHLYMFQPFSEDTRDVVLEKIASSKHSLSFVCYSEGRYQQHMNTLLEERGFTSLNLCENVVANCLRLYRNH